MTSQGQVMYTAAAAVEVRRNDDDVALLGISTLR